MFLTKYKFDFVYTIKLMLLYIKTSQGENDINYHQENDLDHCLSDVCAQKLNDHLDYVVFLL